MSLRVAAGTWEPQRVLRPALDFPSVTADVTVVMCSGYHHA